MARMSVLAVAAVAMACLTLAAAESLPFTNCGTGLVDVKSIDISGTVAAGKTIGLSASGDVSADVTGGHFDIAVQLFGITLLNMKGNICDSKYLSVKCPVAKGPVSAHGQVSIPSIAPKGEYGLKITAKDTSGAALFCLQAKLAIAESDPVDLRTSALLPRPRASFATDECHTDADCQQAGDDGGRCMFDAGGGHKHCWCSHGWFEHRFTCRQHVFEPITRSPRTGTTARAGHDDAVHEDYSPPVFLRGNRV